MKAVLALAGLLGAAGTAAAQALAPTAAPISAPISTPLLAPMLAAPPPATPVPLCMTDFPPYVSAELPDGGSLAALARRAFAAAGLGVQALQVPWVRAFALAKNGECLLLTLWRNDERDALFRYSLPVARMQLGFFVRKGQELPLPADSTVAHQRGSYLPAELTGGRYRLHDVVDPRRGLEMLNVDRVDAVFSERGSFEHLLARQPRGADTVRWAGTVLETKPTYMAISKGHPQAEAWLELLNAEIRRGGGG